MFCRSLDRPQAFRSLSLFKRLLRMSSTHFLYAFLFSLSSYASTSTAQAWPPKASYVGSLGLATDPTFSETVKRDGGGGGYVNGFHLVGFCDSTTQSTLGSGTQDGGVTSFAHNSFAYMGYRNASDPTDLWDFGNITSTQVSAIGGKSATGSGKFSNMFSTAANETGDFAMWTTGNYVPTEDNTQAIGVVNCINEGAENEMLYSSLVAINVTDPRDLSTGDNSLFGERIVPRLFYAGENLYGSFTLYKALDNFLYLFGTSQSSVTGINVARTPVSSWTDRNTYTYWNGFQWSTTQPDIHDASANLFNFSSSMASTTSANTATFGPNTGEVFFSHYHNQTMCIFTDGGVDGTFWLTYPLQGQIIDEWSTPVELYTPQAPTEPCDTGHQWNYAGHSYPDYDPSGKTLLLSWSSCESYIHMATVVWD